VRESSVRAVDELSSSQEPLGAAPAWPPMPPPLKAWTPAEAQAEGCGSITNFFRPPPPVPRGPGRPLGCSPSSPSSHRCSIWARCPHSRLRPRPHLRPQCQTLWLSPTPLLLLLMASSLSLFLCCQAAKRLVHQRDAPAGWTSCWLGLGLCGGTPE